MRPTNRPLSIFVSTTLLSIFLMSSECGTGPGSEFTVEVIGQASSIATGEACAQTELDVCVAYIPKGRTRRGRTQCEMFLTNQWGEFDGTIRSFRPQGQIRSIYTRAQGRRIQASGFSVSPLCESATECRTFVTRLQFRLPRCPQ